MESKGECMNTKEKWQTRVVIRDEVRAAVWGAIFPGARVPVRTLVPVLADLPGLPSARVYFLDLDAVSDAQLAELVPKLAELFSLNPEAVRQDMAATGVPILADNTSLESSDHAMVQSLIADLSSPAADLDPELFRTTADGHDEGN
jgi:hypothetical protein